MSYIHFWTLKCFICLKMTTFYYFLNAKKNPENRDFWVFLPKIELWTPKKGKKVKNQNSGGIKLETTTHSLCI